MTGKRSSASVNTVVTLKRRASATYSGAAKLGCRTSSAWRSFRPATASGSSEKKRSRSCASNTLVGASCQTMGPSLSPSSAMPLPMKRCTDSPASASTRFCVA